MRTLNAKETRLVRFRRPLVLTGGLLGLIVVGSTFFATRPTRRETLVAQTPDAAGVAVKTATVTQERLPLQISAVGTAEAYSSAAVNSDVDGQLTELHFTEGQYVKKGEPLFIVDSRFSYGGFGQAQANHSDTGDQKLAEADLMKDKAEATAAENEADQYDALYKDGVVSKEDDQRARAIADDLETLVKADQAVTASAKEPVSGAEGNVNSSTLSGWFHSIRSPIDGVAEKTIAKRGDIVVASDATPLVTIDQVSPIYVSFSVPESVLPDIDRCRSQGELKVAATIGDDVEVSEPGTPGPIAYATISENGTVALKATFDNKDRRLRPGQPVNVVLTLTTAPDAAVIPSSAVQTDEQGQYVFVVKSDQTVEARPAVVAETVGDKTILTSGLEPGEVVVTDARFPLRAGSKVNVTSNGEALAKTDQK